MFAKPPMSEKFTNSCNGKSVYSLPVPICSILVLHSMARCFVECDDIFV